MSQSSFSFAVSSAEARFTTALLVRDGDGRYRVASADQVLSQTWGVLAERVEARRDAVVAAGREEPCSARLRTDLPMTECRQCFQHHG